MKKFNPRWFDSKPTPKELVDLGLNPSACCCLYHYTEQCHSLWKWILIDNRIIRSRIGWLHVESTLFESCRTRQEARNVKKAHEENQQLRQGQR